MEKLSKTKAKKKLRSFFREKNITEKLSITKQDGIFNVNGVFPNKEISEAIETLKKTFIRRGELKEL